MVTAASIEAMIPECSMYEEHLSAQLADVERDAAWPRYLIWSISSGNSKQNSSRLIRRGYALGQSEHSKARKRGEAAITAATPSRYPDKIEFSQACCWRDELLLAEIKTWCRRSRRSS